MKKPPSLRGTIQVPGDKSITHRAIMFGAVAVGESIIKTSILGRDNFATARIMRQLGVDIQGEVTSTLLPIAFEEGFKDFRDSGSKFCSIRVRGRGFEGLREARETLDCGNSGTTARLLTGLLAGRPFSSTLTGDASLVKRPFRRVIHPLTKMGARFSAELLPFTVTGAKLRGIEYDSPQASAQVKSAILLAGLQAEGPVSVTEPRLSRDHTERMLSSMGCSVRSEELSGGRWKISLPEERPILRAQEISIPGDFSAAAFFLVAGSVFPGSELVIESVGFNETRMGLFNVLKRMGAAITTKNERTIGGERVVDFEVRATQLRGVEVDEEDVVLGVDEIPILLLAAAVAKGRTTVKGAAELRVKESDRLAMTAAIVKSYGLEVEEFSDGLTIEGRPELLERWEGPREDAPAWKKSGDHRIAMTGSLFGLLSGAEFHLPDKAAVETSFPAFDELVRGIMRG